MHNLTLVKKKEKGWREEVIHRREDEPISQAADPVLNKRHKLKEVVSREYPE